MVWSSLASVRAPSYGLWFEMLLCAWEVLVIGES